MNKKITIGFGILILLVIGIMIFASAPGEEGNEYFTLEPTDWIIDDLGSEAQGAKEINVFKATRGKTDMSLTQQDYHIGGDTISFFYHGSYGGEPFDSVYVEPLFYEVTENMSKYEQADVVEDYVKMRISEKMDPNDGIIDGLILGKIEDGEAIFYIFVDEDWVQQIEYTNILWGDSFRDPQSLNIKKFDFSNPIDGIYVNEIRDDVDWFFESPIKGGIMVGEINSEIIQKIFAFDIIEETFMYIR